MRSELKNQTEQTPRIAWPVAAGGPPSATSVEALRGAVALQETEAMWGHPWGHSRLLFLNLKLAAAERPRGSPSVHIGNIVVGTQM